MCLKRKIWPDVKYQKQICTKITKIIIYKNKSNHKKEFTKAYSLYVYLYCIYPKNARPINPPNFRKAIISGQDFGYFEGVAGVEQYHFYSKNK